MNKLMQGLPELIQSEIAAGTWPQTKVQLASLKSEFLEMMNEDASAFRRHMGLKAAWSDTRIGRLTCDIYVMGGLFLLDLFLPMDTSEQINAYLKASQTEHGIDDIMSNAIQSMQAQKLDRLPVTDPKVIAFLTDLTGHPFTLSSAVNDLNTTSDVNTAGESMPVNSSGEDLDQLLNTPINVITN